MEPYLAHRLSMVGWMIGMHNKARMAHVWAWMGAVGVAFGVYVRLYSWRVCEDAPRS